MANGTIICTAFDREVTISESNPFRDTKVIKRVHDRIPRFRNSNDISLLISGTTEEGAEYLTGTVSTSIWIFCFFLFWYINLIVLKCMGSKRAGLFSGYRLRRPRPPRPPEDPSVKEEHTQEAVVTEGEAIIVKDADRQEGKVTEGEAVTFKEEGNHQESSVRESNHADDSSEHNYEDAFKDEGSTDQDPDQGQVGRDYAEQLQEWESRVQISERMLRRIRIVVLTSGLAIVVSAILMTAIGVHSLANASGDVASGLEVAKKLSLEGYALIEDYQLREGQTAQQITSFRGMVNGFCPLVRQTICESLTPVTNCTYDDLPLELRGPVRSILETKREFVYSELDSIQVDLVNIMQTMDDYIAAANNFTWAFWLAAAFSMLVAALTLILMCGVVIAWRGNKNCCQWIVTLVRNWFIVPIYGFCVVISWIFSMVFIIGTCLTADFCVNSPDTKVLVRPKDL
jgi:hypothetical protein